MLLKFSASDVQSALRAYAQGETPTLTASVPAGEVVPFKEHTLADYVLEHWTPPASLGTATAAEMFAASLRAVSLGRKPHIPFDSLAHHVLLHWTAPAYAN